MSNCGHKIVKCVCGKVIAQCRCIQPAKFVEIRICNDCKAKGVTKLNTMDLIDEDTKGKQEKIDG